LALVILVLSNRRLVTFSLWPFPDVQLWLGPVLMAVLAVGFVLGLFAHMPKHFSLRRRARIAEKRVAQLTAGQDSVKPGP
jgi:uncharacterized integral membrane protein